MAPVFLALIPCDLLVIIVKMIVCLSWRGRIVFYRVYVQLYKEIITDPKYHRQNQDLKDLRHSSGFLYG